MSEKIRACSGLERLVAEKVLGYHRGAANTWWLGESYICLDQDLPHWSSDPGEALGLLHTFNLRAAAREESPLALIPRLGISGLEYICGPGLPLHDLGQPLHAPELAIAIGVLRAHGVSREEIEEACRG